MPGIRNTGDHHISGDPMNRIVSLPQLRVTPATSSADWQAAHDLVSELLDWMSSEFNLDAVSVQEGVREELADLARHYSFPRGIVLIGRVEGEVAGCSGIRFIDDDTAELKRVWVRPPYRGSGIAQALLARALDAARALGASRVVLETDPRVMARAVSMYRGHGFREGAAYSSLPQRVPGVLTMEKRVA